MSIWTRFEKEAKANSEMVYFHSCFLSFFLFFFFFSFLKYSIFFFQIKVLNVFVRLQDTV